MRCARCNRPLYDPAAAVGRYGMGEVCTRKAGLLEQRPRGTSLGRAAGRRRSKRTDEQLELELIS